MFLFLKHFPLRVQSLPEYSALLRHLFPGGKRANTIYELLLITELASTIYPLLLDEVTELKMKANEQIPYMHSWNDPIVRSVVCFIP